MKKTLVLGTSIIILMAILSACSPEGGSSMMENMVSGNGGMGGGGMMRFHMAPIPVPYKNLESPILATDDSFARGQLIFTNNCATCHGDGGMGDGPAGVSLDPVPAKIAHTSQMMSDDYLFWRISEGGTEFETAMIPFKNILSENERWDVINYVRALGSGQAMPQEIFGGNLNSPEIQATQQAEMLSTAIEQTVISQDEFDFFTKIHPIIDGYMEENRGSFSSSEGISMMESGLDVMVADGLITQDDAHQFLRIHNLLVDANLMD